MGTEADHSRKGLALGGMFTPSRDGYGLTGAHGEGPERPATPRLASCRHAGLGALDERRLEP